MLTMSNLVQGLYFMHKQHVAHRYTSMSLFEATLLTCAFRDCMTLNIMMDATPLYPVPYHPVRELMKRDMSGQVEHCSRTVQPVKYYWTDFGLSLRYSPEEPTPNELPIWGGDRSVPEYIEDFDVPRNPFPADVYTLGNLVREDLLEVRRVRAAVHIRDLADESGRSTTRI